VKMNDVCIVCGGTATRITEHKASGQSAAVCSTANALKWKRSIRSTRAAPEVTPSPEEFGRAERLRGHQLTFLGGKAVRKG